MRDDAAVLDRLRECFGIAREYYDIAGRRHVLGDAELISLLAEFGVDARTRAGMEQALHEIELARWREAMPPVVVVAADNAAWTLRVRIAADDIEQLDWALLLEDGTRASGSVRVESLAETGCAEFERQTYREVELQFDFALPPGYHTLGIEELAGETLIVAAPERCYFPSGQDSPAREDPEDFRVWGPAVQLYGVRSARNWGIGDFTDLEHLAAWWGARGADIVGLNPLHALFAHNPLHVSPYSPSSRLGLNVLYLDVEAVEDFRECAAARERVAADEFQARLARLRETEFVDYAGVAAAKREILELLYAHFRERHLDGDSLRAQDFRDFQMRCGNALRGQALFEALQEHFHAADPEVWGWPLWPAAYRDCASDAVLRFCEANLARIEWFEYLQWQADLQLGAVRQCCRRHGMRVGLYLDLAVSSDRAGADVWRHASEFAPHASVGAPPDEFNLLGQNWGLPPLRPDRLVARRFRTFIETLRAVMRHAGALRIDHVPGLMRLFWIPAGKTAREGAYVHYPLDDLLAIVALESQRNRCIVIGEDLGTVADELRVALAQRHLLSYKLLWFERTHDGEFTPPAAYPRNALVAVSTHDLATLAGWWSGEDLLTRLRLHLYPDRDAYEHQRAERSADRRRLLRALKAAGVIDKATLPDGARHFVLPFDLLLAVHAYIARAPARVMMVQMEDALGMLDQANMPATVNEHPNWRRKLPLTLEQIATDPRTATLASILAQQRPRPADEHAAAR